MITVPQFKSRLVEMLELKNKQEADDILWALQQIFEEVVEDAETLTLPGIGKLSCSVRSARKGRNPATGESLKIPAKVSVRFTVSKSLKDKVPSVKRGQRLIEEREAEKKRKKRRAEGTKSKKSSKKSKRK